MSEPNIYDLVIIGGGPAGVAAGVYAARKQLRTLFITDEWGGQSTVSPEIQNWIGTPAISGTDLAHNLRTHLEQYAGDVVTVHSPSRATAVNKNGTDWDVTCSDGTHAQSRSVLLTTGSTRRKLEVPGAAEFEHKGLTYCASCDGPLFAGQDVAVIGGGNAGFETAAQLLAYAKSVTLLQRSGEYKADPVTVERVLSHDNMSGICNATPTAVHGDTFVNGLTYTDESGAEQHLAVTGVFVEIGLLPNTDLVADQVTRDEQRRIEIDPWTQATSAPGIWAAGDCTNVWYHQNNIAAGDAVRALEDIYRTLSTRA